MRVAIISDTHLGDPKSTMANQGGVGSRYAQFKSIIKERLGNEIEYLILLGDVMDFAVSSYQDAYEAGKQFFIQLMKDDIAKEIIYVSIQIIDLHYIF
jgi:metallophosphoesterase superfamily enzyme